MLQQVVGVLSIGIYNSTCWLVSSSNRWLLCIQKKLVVCTVHPYPLYSCPIRCAHHWLRTHLKHSATGTHYHADMFCFWHWSLCVPVEAQWYHQSSRNIFHLHNLFCYVQWYRDVHLCSVQLGRQQQQNIHSACPRYVLTFIYVRTYVHTILFHSSQEHNL